MPKKPQVVSRLFVNHSNDLICTVQTVNGEVDLNLTVASEDQLPAVGLDILALAVRTLAPKDPVTQLQELVTAIFARVDRARSLLPKDGHNKGLLGMEDLRADAEAITDRLQKDPEDAQIDPSRD